MSTGAIIMVVVAAAVLAGALGAYLSARVRKGGDRSRELRHRFGPEYELAVAGHAGDTKAAERELHERLQRHGSLRPRPLTAEQRGQYAAEWARIRETFLETPPTAVTDAEGLLDRLARDRGFPAGKAVENGEHDEQVAALSVHHAGSVQGYRQIRTAAVRARGGRAETEELREALVHANAFFQELTAPPAEKSLTGGTADAGAGTDGAPGNGGRRFDPRTWMPRATRTGGRPKGHGV